MCLRQHVQTKMCIQILEAKLPQTLQIRKVKTESEKMVEFIQKPQNSPNIKKLSHYRMQSIWTWHNVIANSMCTLL
jgi:hypothetical protein